MKLSAVHFILILIPLTNYALAANAPSVPTGLQGSAENYSTIDITWQPSTVASGSIAAYYIYTFDDDIPIAVVDGSTLYFRNTGLSGSINIPYRVAALSSDNVLSSKSDRIWVYAPDPVLVATNIVDGQTLAQQVTWTITTESIIPNRVEFYVDGRLKYQTSVSPYQFGGPSGLLDTTTLKNGSHSLLARAVYGNGSFEQKMISINIANSPGSFTATATSEPNSILLTWSSSNLASRYSISYGTTSGAYTTLISDSAVSPLTISNLVPGTQYFISVQAINSVGSTLAPEVSAQPTSGPAPIFSTSLLVSNTRYSGTVYERIKVSRAGQRDTYMEFIHGIGGNTTQRPTVLLTRPYDGFDWSQDPTDLYWSTNPQATAGYNAPDSFAPGFDPSSPNYIHYQIADPDQLYNETLFLIYQGFNVATVFNRFYAGGTFLDDANDTSLAIQYLAQRTDVDPGSLSLYGGSWGAMVAAYGVALAKIPIKSLVLVTPLLDINGLTSYYKNYLPANLTCAQCASQLNMFESFYFPYGLRIAPVAANPPPEAQALLSLSDLATQLNQLCSDIYVYGDDWDSIIPPNSTKSFVQLLSPSITHSFWWGHATPLDLTTATIGHSQSTEPLITTAQFALDQFEILSTTLGPNVPTQFYIVWDNDWWNFIEHVRAQQLRGQDISGLLPIFIKIAGNNVTVTDQTNPAYNLSGPQFVSEMLKNYWNSVIDPSVVQSVLMTSGFPN